MRRYMTRGAVSVLFKCILTMVNLLWPTFLCRIVYVNRNSQKHSEFHRRFAFQAVLTMLLLLLLGKQAPQHSEKTSPHFLLLRLPPALRHLMVALQHLMAALHLCQLLFKNKPAQHQHWKRQIESNQNTKQGQAHLKCMKELLDTTQQHGERCTAAM